jgi:hypothetical protein
VSNQEFTEDQLVAIRRVEKLLTLSKRGGTEAEAEAAAAKAQELLELYNLDMAKISAAGGGGVDSGRREQMAVRGGARSWERELWGAVARLNFCLHFTRSVRIEIVRKGQKRSRVTSEHVVIGRTINVRLTQSIANYLRDAIERILRERNGNDPSQLHSNWSNSFRRGAFDRLCERLENRRNEKLAEERERQAKATRDAAGYSSGTALVLSNYIDQENDANYDFLYGEGFSARQAQARAERAEARRRQQEEHTRWAAENPEEARELERKRREEQEALSKKWANRGKGSRGGKVGPDIDNGAYWSGYDRANEVGLDDQVQSTPGQRRLAS